MRILCGLLIGSGFLATSSAQAQDAPSNACMVVVSQTDKGKAIVGISSSSIVYFAMKFSQKEGGGGFFRRNEEIRSLHVALYPGEDGIYRMSFEECEFGVSLKVYGKREDSGWKSLRSIPIGVAGQETGGGYFARFYVDDVEALPKNERDFDRFDVFEAKMLANKSAQ